MATSLGCFHDWDALDPLTGAADDVCVQYCEVYQRCVEAAAADCVTRCEGNTASCSVHARGELLACVAELDDSCGDFGNELNFDVCAGQVACWNG